MFEAAGKLRPRSSGGCNAALCVAVAITWSSTVHVGLIKMDGRGNGGDSGGIRKEFPISSHGLSSRFLNRDFEDAAKLHQWRIKRILHRTASIDDGCMILPWCTSRQLTLPLLLYSLFPAFSVLDLCIGALAKSQSWYDKSLCEHACDWSVTACAVWIAVTLSGVLVAAFALLGKIKKWWFASDQEH